MTEFDIPTASSTAQDIVLGPDGKLWFTENAGDKIGRVTPGNPPLIEEFDVPTNFVEPLNITVGPDNKIWFSGKFNGAGGVGRMDPANPADTQGHRRLRQSPSRAGSPPALTARSGSATPAAASVVRIDPATGVERGRSSRHRASRRHVQRSATSRRARTGTSGSPSFGAARSPGSTPAGAVTPLRPVAGERGVGHRHGRTETSGTRVAGREPGREDHHAAGGVRRLPGHARRRSVRASRVGPGRRAVVRAGRRRTASAASRPRGQFTEIGGLTAGCSARVHRLGSREHALVHGEGRKQDRPDHRHRRAAAASASSASTQRSRVSRASGSRRRSSASAGAGP